jgi:hypothetical protein
MLRSNSALVYGPGMRWVTMLPDLGVAVLLLVLALGFMLGYGVRAAISHRRREAWLRSRLYARADPK